MTAIIRPAATLLEREVVRFLRQRNRIIGALGTPLVFWFLIGSGLGDSFATGNDGARFLEYFFPGALLLTILFTAIFSTISVIEDRREGFLQAVLVSPAPRAAVVLGKLLGGTCLALIQGLLFLAIAPLLGLSLGWASVLYACVIIGFAAFGLTGLGFLFAWRLDSTQGFHAFMNLILMPLWLLSGALFPIAGTPGWLRAVMTVNPVTYAVSGLQHAFLGGTQAAPAFLSSRGAAAAVCGAFAALMFVAAVRTASERKEARS